MTKVCRFWLPTWSRSALIKLKLHSHGRYLMGMLSSQNLPYQFKERANQQTHFKAFGTYLTKDYKIISCNDLKTKVATVI